MKKILTVIAFTALCLLSFGQVTKAETCDISNTAPGSENSCVVSNEYTCKVVNVNDIQLINNNEQFAGSGSVSGDGGAMSGTATNTSGTVFTIKVENNACAVLTAAKPTPSPSPTPTPTAAPTSTPAPTPTVKVLAKTGSNDATSTIVTAVAGLGLAAVLSTLGVTVYRRLQ